MRSSIRSPDGCSRNAVGTTAVISAMFRSAPIMPLQATEAAHSALGAAAASARRCSRRDSSGARYASVLPLPVSAASTRLWPPSRGFAAAACRAGLQLSAGPP